MPQFHIVAHHGFVTRDDIRNCGRLSAAFGCSLHLHVINWATTKLRPTLFKLFEYSGRCTGMWNKAHVNADHGSLHEIGCRTWYCRNEALYSYYNLFGELNRLLYPADKSEAKHMALTLNGGVDCLALCCTFFLLISWFDIRQCSSPVINWLRLKVSTVSILI